MNKNQALQWCINNIESWPTTMVVPDSPDGWKWYGNTNYIVLRKFHECGEEWRPVDNNDVTVHEWSDGAFSNRV